VSDLFHYHVMLSDHVESLFSVSQLLLQVTRPRHHSNLLLALVSEVYSEIDINKYMNGDALFCTYVALIDRVGC